MPRNEQAGEKTEEPTPRRKEKVREEGQVAKSQELNAAFTLLGSFLVLYILFQGMLESLQSRMIQHLTLEGYPALDSSISYDLVIDAFIYIATLVGPVMIAAAVVGAVINFIQVGPLFSTKTIQPQLSNINPISGLKNIFSLKSVMELLKSVFKAVVIAVLAYNQLRQVWPRLITMPEQGLRPSLVLMGELIFRIGINIIIFLIVLGVADYIYQRWEFRQNIMMTKREVKEERKETEGDPLIKQRRREQQRQFSINRMMSKMEEADVVVTNPIHIAVALQYELDEMEAPEVVAKGEGFVAQRIKDKAEELGIEIVENRSLARALHETTEIGDQIPSDLYQAVAEVLAFVFQKNNKFNPELS
ncbi:MAG: flagellar biosynthesis protein FlhB [Bacillota bacterium]